MPLFARASTQTAAVCGTSTVFVVGSLPEVLDERGRRDAGEGADAARGVYEEEHAAPHLTLLQERPCSTPQPTTRNTAAHAQWTRYDACDVSVQVYVFVTSYNDVSVNQHNVCSHVRVCSPAAELFVVRHVFTASDASHLPLQMGRIVEVLEKSNNGWWRGTIDDDTGWFPASYVTKIDGSAATLGHVYVIIQNILDKCECV